MGGAGTSDWASSSPRDEDLPCETTSHCKGGLDANGLGLVAFMWDCCNFGMHSDQDAARSVRTCSWSRLCHKTQPRIRITGTWSDRDVERCFRCFPTSWFQGFRSRVLAVLPLFMSPDRKSSASPGQVLKAGAAGLKHLSVFFDRIIVHTRKNTTPSLLDTSRRTRMKEEVLKHVELQ